LIRPLHDTETFDQTRHPAEANSDKKQTDKNPFLRISESASLLVEELSLALEDLSQKQEELAE
jgi:hypothetical protein